MTYKHDPNTNHILLYPMLFSAFCKVQHFRTLNYAAMLRLYRQAEIPDQVTYRLKSREMLTDRGLEYFENRLKISRAHFFTLDVRREEALEDAFDQLRGREMRELGRPLKVLIGRNEAGGETGLDQGGLTQEFFALVVAKAFDEDYGMFTTDDISRLSWFRPLSPVPLYKFELLGMIFSLAVYNGAVIPVNLPEVFYRRLLHNTESSTINDILDGWPDLATSLKQLEHWDESQGDVADVLVREYKFSFETPDFLPRPLPDGWQVATRTPRGFALEYDLGKKKQAHTNAGLANGVTDDIARTTDETPQQTASANDDMVTNCNRHGFIKDYIHFLLVESVRPQYEAFARGFHTLLSPKALSILDPILLERLTEGTHELDVNELQRFTTYENGYSSTHPVIKQFWQIVRAWPSEKQRKLLEFVTASDRVPVTGLRTVAFSIVRNGATDELPTSQTCFGKFNLPEYKDGETLDRMLNVAIEYGQGFGVM